MNPRQVLVLCALLGLTSACTEPLLDAQEEIAGADTEPAPESVEVEPIDSNGADVFARLETCELDEALDARIRDLAERLDELRLRFTERHPDIVEARQLMEDLERTALENCVEALQ